MQQSMQGLDPMSMGLLQQMQKMADEHPEISANENAQYKQELANLFETPQQQQQEILVEPQKVSSSPAVQPAFTPYIEEQSIKQPEVLGENYAEPDVPSEFAFYAEPFQMQPLKAIDSIPLAKLARETISKKDVHDTINEVLLRHSKNLSVNDLLIGDEIPLLMWLRLNSFPGVPVNCTPFKCGNPKCPSKNGEFIKSVAATELSFEPVTSVETLKSLQTGPGYRDIEVAGRQMRIWLKRRKHVASMWEFVRLEESKSKRKISENALEYLKVASNTLIDGITSLGDAYKFIVGMSSVDFDALMKEYAQFSFKTKPVIRHVCKTCGQEAVLPGRPFRFIEYIPNIELYLAI
jgi:hypothetical protein